MFNLTIKMRVVLLSFVTIIGAVTGLMYKSCYGIAYSGSGELVVGMENPMTHTEYLYFYDSDQGLRAVEKFSSVVFTQTGRYGSPVMNFNDNCITVYSKPTGLIYYDYNGKKINADIEADENFRKAGYYFELQDGGTVVWEQRLGFEYVSVRTADGSSKRIGFLKLFFFQNFRRYKSACFNFALVNFI